MKVRIYKYQEIYSADIYVGAVFWNNYIYIPILGPKDGRTDGLTGETKSPLPPCLVARNIQIHLEIFVSIQSSAMEMCKIS